MLFCRMVEWGELVGAVGTISLLVAGLMEDGVHASFSSSQAAVAPGPPTTVVPRHTTL